MRITMKKDPQAEKVLDAVRANDGYCPCSLIKNEDTKCICMAFLESAAVGECSCGLYVKTEV